MRKKPKIETAIIYDDQGIDQALADIAKSERRIEAIKNDLNDRVDALKAVANIDVTLYQNSIKAIEGGLAIYVQQHKDRLIGKNKSKKFTFGLIGFRKSTELKPLAKWTWKKILEILVELKEKSAIRVKREVDKEELRGWSDEELKQVGVRKKTEDKFFYETQAEIETVN